MEETGVKVCQTNNTDETASNYCKIKEKVETGDEGATPHLNT